jgi:hypothetical protein
LQPLLDASGLTRTALARRLGLSSGVIVTAGRRGLTDPQADQWTIGVGLHPLAVWGWAWVDDADTAAGRAPYMRLAVLIRDEIDQGVWLPGEPLPGIHALAKRWRVGARTVAQALDELRFDGVVVGGEGRGTRSVVATTLTGGPARCAVCGRPVDLGDEHYPHRPHCTLAVHAWCDCEGAAHPECCPTCAGAPS